MTAAIRDLLAAVAESPGDPDLRLVAADAILERGGPRAELVALEMERRTQPFDKKRELRHRALVAEHGAELAGALDAWLRPENRVFEGGFLVAGTLKALPSASQMNALEWRLVRDLELPPTATTNEALAILTHSQMVSLRGMYGLTCVAARTLTAMEPSEDLAPLTSLGVRHLQETDVALGHARAFPSLERLVVDWRESSGGGDWADFTRAGLGASIRELEILAIGEIVGWLPRLATTKVATLTMNLGSEGGAWAAEGDWRLSLELRTYAMTATFHEGEDVAKPNANGLGTLLMNWRNPTGKVASLAIDEAYLARMQSAQRKRIDAIIQHVGVAAEIREKSEAARRVAAELASFHYRHQLYLTNDGRFAFRTQTTLHRGALGARESVIETRVVHDWLQKLQDDGYRRTYRKATLVHVMGILQLPVPPILLAADRP